MFIRCLFVIGRKLSNEQQATASEIIIEPATLILANGILPQSVDIGCIIQRPGFGHESLCASQNSESRRNSYGSISNQNERQEII